MIGYEKKYADTEFPRVSQSYARAFAIALGLFVVTAVPTILLFSLTTGGPFRSDVPNVIAREKEVYG
jgi:hypothetical protein